MKYLIITILSLISLSIKAQYVSDTAITKQLLHLEIIFWEAKSDSTKLDALLSKANVYKLSGMNEQALAELERAEKYCTTTTAISLLKYEKMLNYFLSGKYNYAGNITIPYPEIEQIHKTKEYTTMKLMSLDESEKWEQCKQELLILISPEDSSKIHGVEQLPVTYNYISPEYCSRLSSFIPGLGEIKAGYPIKGATSFLIHSGLLFFIGYNYYAGFYLTGTISGGLPFFKFYGGGKRLSAKLAEKHNENAKKNLKKKYSEIIEKTIPD